jgi:hypothetical protein
LDAVAGDRFDLTVMPIAGVGQHDLRVADLDGAQLALRGADHRFQVSEVGRVGGQLGSDDELPVVDGQLGVVALSGA